jgi:hypothetical protein
VRHLSISAFLAHSDLEVLRRERAKGSLFINNNEVEGRKEVHPLSEEIYKKNQMRLASKHHGANKYWQRPVTTHELTDRSPGVDPSLGIIERLTEVVLPRRVFCEVQFFGAQEEVEGKC